MYLSSVLYRISLNELTPSNYFALRLWYEYLIRTGICGPSWHIALTQDAQ